MTKPAGGMFGQIDLTNVQGALRKFVIKNVGDEFETVKEIGHGGFGKVMLATQASTGEKVAVKQLFATTLVGKDYVSYTREVKVLSLTRNSPCLIGLIGFTTCYPYAIVTPYIPNGSLFQALGHRSGREQLTSTQRTIIAMGVAYGMRHLHDLGIIHRDLKSLNVLLDYEMHPWICDFGISWTAEEQSENAMMTMNIGTPHWMAPEMFTSSNYNAKVDVYAFGMLLWEILTEDTPFKGKDAFQVGNLVNNGSRPSLPSDIPAGLKEMITACWSQVPENRPDFNAIYEAFRNKEVMFKGADASEIDQYAKHLEACDQGQERVSLDLKSIVSTGLTSDVIEQVTRSVTASNAVKFFRDCSIELSQCVDSRSDRILLEVITAVLNNGKTFVDAFVEAGLSDRDLWRYDENSEYVHRVIATALYFDNRSYGPDVVSHMVCKLRFCEPVTILHALSSIFSAYGKVKEIMPVFTTFLQYSSHLCQKGGAIAVSQLLFFLWSRNQDICMMYKEGFNQAISYVLVSNIPRAIHDIYMLYSHYFRVPWPINDDYLLLHLSMPGVRYSALSYMVRCPTPINVRFIPVLAQLSREFTMAGVLLCRISQLGDRIVGLDVSILEYICLMPKVTGARAIFGFCQSVPISSLIGSSNRLQTYLRELVEENESYAPGVAALVKQFPVTPEVNSHLRSSGLLSTLDSIILNSSPSLDVMRLLSIHAFHDGLSLPENYSSLVGFYDRYMWGESSDMSLCVFAALYSLSVHRDAQRSMTESGLLQRMLCGDYMTYLNYIGAIFTACGQSLPPDVLARFTS